MAAPDGVKPKLILPSVGISAVTIARRRVLNPSPARINTRLIRSCQILPRMKEGWIDCAWIGVKLPNSLACRKALMNPARSLGEMAKTLSGAATNNRLDVSAAMYSTGPRPSTAFMPRMAPAHQMRGNGRSNARSLAGRTHSISPVGISSLRRPHFNFRLSRRTS